tara:strand:+ start:502 stop:684 length:183 start_codon:yes stop_codon:yes gene_type:complete
MPNEKKMAKQKANALRRKMNKAVAVGTISLAQINAMKGTRAMNLAECLDALDNGFGNYME